MGGRKATIAINVNLRDLTTENSATFLHFSLNIVLMVLIVLHFTQFSLFLHFLLFFNKRKHRDEKILNGEWKRVLVHLKISLHRTLFLSKIEIIEKLAKIMDSRMKKLAQSLNCFLMNFNLIFRSYCIIVPNRCIKIIKSFINQTSLPIHLRAFQQQSYRHEIC